MLLRRPPCWRPRASCRSTCASPATARRSPAGHSIVDFLEADERGADACVIFDGHMLRRASRSSRSRRAASRTSTYGSHGRARSALGRLRRGGAERDARAHADARGGACRSDGRLPESLRRASCRRRDEELAGWGELSAGADVLGAQGARPADAARRRRSSTCARGRSLRSTSTASRGGCRAPEDGAARGGRGERVDPAGARPGRRRDLARGGAACSGRPRRREPRWRSSARHGAGGARRARGAGDPARPGRVRARARRAPAAPPRRRLAAGDGRPRAKGIPTILTGFDLPEGNIHSPNERLPRAHAARRRGGEGSTESSRTCVSRGTAMSGARHRTGRNGPRPLA